MITDPDKYRELFEEYESLFGEPEIGEAEVGLEEFARLLRQSIDSGEPIRRSDYYPKGVLT